VLEELAQLLRRVIALPIEFDLHQIAAPAAS
jgi:hypothetical protein